MARNGNGAQIYDGLIARGFGPVQAAVLTGNIEQESGFDPTAWNAKEGAGGLLQWRMDRLSGLQDYAAQSKRDPADVDTQLDWLVTEMTGPKEGRNAAAFLAATDPQAANDALHAYIRYAPASKQQRLGNAMAYMTPQRADDGFNQLFAAGGAPAGDDDALFEEIFSPAGKPSGAATGDIDAEFEALFGPGSGENVIQLKGDIADLPSKRPSLGDEALSFGRGVIEGIPVLGQPLADARRAVDAHLMAALHGGNPEDYQQQFKESDEALKAKTGGARTAGSVVGAIAPLVAAGGTALGAKALGMSGSLPSRIGFGALSGFGLTGADTLARGGTTEEAASNALLGGALGGVLPVVGNRLGATWNAFAGPRAETVLNSAMAADQVSPRAANALLDARGPGMMVADLGPNVQQLASGLASVPGPAQSIVKSAIAERAAGAGNRLTGAVDEALGTGRPIETALAEVTAAQKAAADPLYAAVRPQAVQITPTIAGLQTTPMGKKAMERAMESLANDQMDATRPTVALYDAMKQALDDMASSAARQGSNNEARQASRLAEQLRNEIDRQVPAYKEARDAFAGPAAIKDAMELGRDVFTRKMSPTELKSTLAGMSTSEKDALLLGAQDAVQAMIGNARTDVAGVKQAFASDYAKEKLALLLGDDTAEAIEKALAREAIASQTNQLVAGNSVTAARQEAQKMVAPELARLPAQQTVTGLLLAGIEKARQAITAKYRMGQNARLANMLMAPNLGPQMLSQIEGAAPGAANALLAPGSVPLLAEQNRLLPQLPLEIRVPYGQ